MTDQMTALNLNTADAATYRKNLRRRLNMKVWNSFWSRQTDTDAFLSEVSYAFKRAGNDLEEREGWNITLNRIDCYNLDAMAWAIVWARDTLRVSAAAEHALDAMNGWQMSALLADVCAECRVQNDVPAFLNRRFA